MLSSREPSPLGNDDGAQAQRGTHSLTLSGGVGNLAANGNSLQTDSAIDDMIREQNADSIGSSINTRGAEGVFLSKSEGDRVDPSATTTWPRG